MRATIPLEERLAAALASRGLDGADVAVVLGSGLGAFADELDDARIVAFGDVDGMPTSAVPGHAGRFVLGRIDDARVLVQQGRVHLYEGWEAHEVCASVRAMHRSGAKALVLTNAAGGLEPSWPMPCLMRVTDHMNMTGVGPLRVAEQARGTPYDPAAGDALEAAAAASGVELHAGVYAGLLGPSYETPAEIRWLGSLGAQAVGMSTVIEASVAAAVGMRVAAVSCITNAASGLTDRPLVHDEVVAAGESMRADFVRLLVAAIPRIASA